MKNNLLLKSVIFLVIFIVVKILLNLFSLEFIKWVYIVSFLTFVILWTLGWFQYINDINKKWLKYTLYAFVIILAVIILFVASFINSWIPKEKIVKVENKKVVEKYREWGKGEIITSSYYKYYNIFIRGKNKISTSSIN